MGVNPMNELPAAAQLRPLGEQLLADTARGILRVPICRATGAALHYGHSCLPDAVTWVDASGRASLYAFTVLWQAHRAQMKVPYNVAWVELEEGPRLVSAVVVDDMRRLRVGMPLVAHFDGQGTLVFLPAQAPASKSPARDPKA